MGITGLIGLVEKASTPVTIGQMRGSVCVVDAHGWLHRASYGCADQLYSGEHTDKYVWYCLRRLQQIIDSGIKPIVVFDGQRLPAKEVTHRNRQSLRHDARQKVELLLADGQVAKAKDLMRNCIEVTPEMAKNLMNALRDKGIDFVVSPFEADAQMAYLVNNGFADFVITEDSDLLVYNCRLCLFKLDLNGYGKLVDMSLLTECLGNSFDLTKFRHMSILSGCDYLPNLPGIGLQRAKKFFKLTANTNLQTLLYKVPNYLNMAKKVKITKDYVNDFIKADNTFKYQLVFCPKQRKLVPLTPYQNGIKAEDLKYAGTHFDRSLGQDFAFQYAIGNIDTKSLKVIDSYAFEPNDDSIWSENWFAFKNKFTTNPIVLKKSKLNKVSLIGDQKQSNRSEIVSQTEAESQISQYFSRKRIKVSENSFINCSQLKEEYSSQNNQNTKVSAISSTQKSSISRNRVYSRNIFKVGSDPVQEKVIQSKYFNNQSEMIEETVQKSPLTTRVVNEPNLSQYSLNSSGNTTFDSCFDDTLTNGSDRSEISETDEEEILAISSFTNLKNRTNGSSDESLLNSTFISASNKTDIRSYFNSFQ